MTKPEDKAGVWRRDEVESPCIQVCVVHPEARICTGCHRSLDEIATWSRLSPEARRAIMADLPGRADLLRVRRGGRAARITR
ncbi:MAG: DUF1289 domain-containing protein [Salibaculum sp.]|jgi:predicted Fe-S protein YdhL (DUF1289 family)|uniref:DUF1289 domain-containing protein n=1 Tax=Salibaculum sp. TaxID=2855480 RepID=UPI0028709A37|nr:DUF1289 domain-containing protein [Salibaculum sp.]MDR9427546.1 DUF1289 domain-containing protein [Salibaculum sp.]MDR9482817.1 DUF1289 domain-containing protein [Salibaculum sp.]